MAQGCGRDERPRKIWHGSYIERRRRLIIGDSSDKQQGTQVKRCSSDEQAEKSLKVIQILKFDKLDLSVHRLDEATDLAMGRSVPKRVPAAATEL